MESLLGFALILGIVQRAAMEAGAMRLAQGIDGLPVTFLWLWLTARMLGAAAG